MLVLNAARACAVAFIITICAFGQVNVNIPAFTSTSSSSFPPVGIASTETLQVILSNTATALANPAAVPTEPAPSCSGTVAFYDATGTMIGTTSFTLTAGQISQVSLPYASAASSSVRALVRAVVSLTTTFPGGAACSLSYSLATFETTTGITHAIVTGAGISGIATPLLGHL